MSVLEVLVTGHPAALQLDHHEVPEESQDVHVLLLRVVVETVTGEAGDDAVQLILDDGKKDEEGKLGTPDQDQGREILNKRDLSISRGIITDSPSVQRQ